MTTLCHSRLYPLVRDYEFSNSFPTQTITNDNECAKCTKYSHVLVIKNVKRRTNSVIGTNIPYSIGVDMNMIQVHVGNCTRFQKNKTRKD
jgi:hypothetical protein